MSGVSIVALLGWPKTQQLPTLMGRELLSALSLGAGAITLRAVAQCAHSASLLRVDIVLGQNGWAAVLQLLWVIKRIVQAARLVTALGGAHDEFCNL